MADAAPRTDGDGKLVCPKCSLVTERVCVGCGLDLVTGEKATAAPREAGPAEVELFTPALVLDEGEKEGRRRVLSTIARNARAAAPSTIAACILAGVALDQSLVPSLGEDADFSVAMRLVTTFLLALTLVEHARSCAADAASVLFAETEPFDLGALPRSFMVAVPTSLLLGMPILAVARTIDFPLYGIITIPFALLVIVVGPAVAGLIVVGEGVFAISPKKIFEVIWELGGVYFEAARYMIGGVGLSLTLVWAIPGASWLRGPGAVIAMAVAGAAMGSLARTVAGESLLEHEKKRPGS